MCQISACVQNSAEIYEVSSEATRSDCHNLAMRACPRSLPYTSICPYHTQTAQRSQLLESSHSVAKACQLNDPIKYVDIVSLFSRSSRGVSLSSHGGKIFRSNSHLGRFSLRQLKHSFYSSKKDFQITCSTYAITVMNTVHLLL